MSRDWTPEELQAASEAMKAAGHMSYEEFCEAFSHTHMADNAAVSSLRELQQASKPAGIKTPFLTQKTP